MFVYELSGCGFESSCNYCSCYNYFFENIEYREKIIKIYFNIEYIKFFYLLQKKLNKNICNIYVLIDIFINLYDNSDINCNKKNKLHIITFAFQQ